MNTAIRFPDTYSHSVMDRRAADSEEKRNRKMKAKDIN